MNEFAQGLVLGFGLLTALGPKDVFVIKNSFSGKYSIALIAICSLSDALLIMVGIVGLGAIVSGTPWLLKLTMATGIAYLLFFSVNSLRSAYAGTHASLPEAAAGHHEGDRSSVMAGALFHSLLTPYAWIDTVLVIGAVCATKPVSEKYFFAGGAMTASLLWFIVLTTGSRWASHLFSKRRAWQALDLIVAASMLMLSYQLVIDTRWVTT